MKDPLDTRSLPGHIWESVPESIKGWDNVLQERLVSMGQNSPKTLEVTRFLTENPWSISAFLVILIFFFLGWGKKKEPFRQRIYYLLYCGTWLGLSDLMSSQLKILFGRLKPHVDFYNPNYLPALSLPSNHSFNSAMLFALVLLTGKLHSKGSFFVGLFICILIGASRVLLGQHYPLDILMGWIFGTLLGLVAARIWRHVLETDKNG